MNTRHKQTLAAQEKPTYKVWKPAHGAMQEPFLGNDAVLHHDHDYIKKTILYTKKEVLTIRCLRLE